MEVQRDLAQDATEKAQFEEQLKEWATHNEEVTLVREEQNSIVVELRKAQQSASQALKIARDLGDGKADAVKKAAAAMSSSAKKDLAKAEAA